MQRRATARARAATYDAGDLIGLWVMTLGVIVAVAMAMVI